MFFIKANTLAKKERHSRLYSKFMELPKESKLLLTSPPEKNFFLRVVISGFALFVFSFVVPTFFATEAEFWLPPEVSAETLEEKTIALAEEGFLIKPEISTEKSNREYISEVIEIEVQAGDTISGLAQKYGISAATIIQNNDLINPNRLKKGQKLTILPVDGLLYVVQKGDTIDKLAKKYKTEDGKIIAQNNLEENGLVVDKRIIIPGAHKEVPPPARIAARPGGGSVFRNPPTPTGGNAAVDYDGTLLFPCQGRYTQYYHPGHYAVDIAQGGGSSVWAAEGGKVVKAQGGWNGGYGNMVVIDHGGGMKTLYAHLREIYVNVGDYVARGQSLGYMGNTGRVYGRTGIHLHFEVTINGVKKDPRAYF